MLSELSLTWNQVSICTRRFPAAEKSILLIGITLWSFGTCGIQAQKSFKLRLNPSISLEKCGDSNFRFLRDKFKWSYKDTKHEASIIQTQTPISTGNSGGPLIDNDGYLIGVNSFKSKGENLNFAVTSLEVVDFIKGLKTSLKKEPEKRKPKVNKKIAKKVDTNGDGKADTFYVDENGDGKIDFVLKDSDHNGKPDMIGRDTNGDGKPDLIAVDRGENGTLDIWYADTNYDGKPDVSGIDTNGDGKPDKFKKIG